ncbi:MAG TPA: hypothetical protein VJ437_03750 [Acidiferrobacterales bacterium]|nr:hypothetical protein [Acidiferrobacterales bacterium]
MHAKSGLWSRAAVLFVIFFASLTVTPAVADAVPPGKSVIYLITRDTGAFSSVLVSVNGRIVGTAKPATHFVIMANPGATEISSAGSGRGTISLTTASGGRYYVTHSIGMSGSPEFRVLSETDGQGAVARTRMLAEVGSVPVLSPDSAPRSVAPRGVEARDTRQSGTAFPEAFYDKQAVAIILKGGAYKISDGMHLTDSIPTLTEEKSTSTWGLEVEWRHPKGFAVGGEIFSFRNKWEDIIGYAGDVTTYTYTVNGKYYLGIGRIVYPYVGVGVGVAVSTFSGTQGGTGFTYEDSYTGVAYQGLVGIEFRFKYVGVNLQYKHLAADVETQLIDGTTETNKMGGTGQLLGLTLHIPTR